MMIIPTNDSDKFPMDTKQPLADDEPPPSYASHADASSIASGSTSASPSAPTFKSKPTNFLKLYNADSSIRGEFVIDPSMRIPESMCPPLGEDETEDGRKNLCLTSRCSSVRAEVWLVGSGGGSEGEAGKEGAHGDADVDGDTDRRRTTIALRSDHGSVHAQLNTLDDPPRAPFALAARAGHGGIRLGLPRTFHGILALSTRHGHIVVSDAIVQNATQLAQVGDVRRYFVGEFSALGEDGWDGDEVECEAPHGSIKIRYVDEGGEGGKGRKKGLLSRLFGK